MKIRYVILICCVWTVTALGQDPGALFFRAAEAYDENRLDEARADYETLLEQNVTAPALYYNYANTLFRSGDTAKAILYYRKAWFLRPSDPDSRANLEFALKTADAPSDVPSWPGRVATAFSLKVWLTLAFIAYALSAVCWMAFLLTRRRWFVLQRSALILLAVALLSAIPCGWWIRYLRHPDAVVMNDSTVRYAPLPDATVHYAAPAGSLLRQIDVSDDWIKVELDGKTGWIPQKDCVPVIPL